MKKIFSNKYLLFLFRILLSFIFIYSGVEKITDPAGFSLSISNYKLLPDFLVNISAIILPWIEFISGILLLFGISVKENSFILTALLGIFIVAVSISLARGLNIDCGCFGTASGQKVGLQKIIENILLFFIGILLIIFNSDFLTLKEK